jgi:large subunit ribosomal protein L2
LALVEWTKGDESGKKTKEYAYFLAAEGLKPGERIYVGSGKREEQVQASFGGAGRNRVGTTRPLKEIPIGTMIFNVELEPGKGGKYIRSAGTGGRRLRKPEGKALIRLPSGTRIEVSEDARATIGRVAGQEHRMESVGKAGRNRNRGWRPTVRGEAMNPIDHPHGGRTRGGRPEVTPWGRIAKGKPTRSRKKVSKWMVVR